MTTLVTIPLYLFHAFPTFSSTSIIIYLSKNQSEVYFNIKMLQILRSEHESQECDMQLNCPTPKHYNNFLTITRSADIFLN